LPDKCLWGEKSGQFLPHAPVISPTQDSITRRAQRVAADRAESYNEQARIIGSGAKSETE
jgi:hypothetical protein